MLKRGLTRKGVYFPTAAKVDPILRRPLSFRQSNAVVSRNANAVDRRLIMSRHTEVMLFVVRRFKLQFALSASAAGRRMSIPYRATILVINVGRRFSKRGTIVG